MRHVVRLLVIVGGALGAMLTGGALPIVATRYGQMPFVICTWAGLVLTGLGGFAMAYHRLRAVDE